LDLRVDPVKSNPSKALRIQHHDEVDAEVGDALAEAKVGSIHEEL